MTVQGPVKEQQPDGMSHGGGGGGGPYAARRPPPPPRLRAQFVAKGARVRPIGMGAPGVCVWGGGAI